MATLTKGELRDIIEDRARVYTPAAHEAAALELASRPELEREPEPAAPEPPAVTIFSRFRAWRNRLLPNHMPDRIRDLFWAGVAAAIPAFVSVGLALTSTKSAVSVLANRDNLSMLTLGAAGLILAYGVYTERRYARPFAIVLVGLWWLATFRWLRLAATIEAGAGVVPGKFDTVRYLLRDPEAKVLIAPDFPMLEDVAKRLRIKPARAAELRRLVLELHGGVTKANSRESASPHAERTRSNGSPADERHQQRLACRTVGRSHERRRTHATMIIRCVAESPSANCKTTAAESCVLSIAASRSSSRGTACRWAS